MSSISADTALLVAVNAVRQPDLIKLLVDAKADSRAVSKGTGEAALGLAIINGMTDAVQVLVNGDERKHRGH